MCDCGESEAGKYFSKIGGQFGDLATNKALRLVDYGKQRIKNWTGFGDYQIKSNSLIQGAEGGNLQLSTQGRSTFIKWREYLGDVATHPTTVGAFNATTYTINPANIQTFPWLSTIASEYEQYKPRGIIFEFRSTATDTTTNASLGSILMATDYDLLDQTFKNKQEMMNTAYSSEAKMSNNLLHGIECDPQELDRKLFFTRNGNNSANAVAGDRDYDVCKTTIATQGGGLAAGQSVGSLFVHYEFEFLKEATHGGIPARNVLTAYYKNTQTYPYLVLGGLGMELNGGYDFGITYSSNRMIIPRSWGGAVFRILFQYVQDTTYTSGPPLPITYVNCERSEPKNGQNITEIEWANMFAPYNTTVHPAIMSAIAETHVRLFQPIYTDAEIDFGPSTNWGVFPSVPGTSPRMRISITMIPNNLTT